MCLFSPPQRQTTIIGTGRTMNRASNALVSAWLLCLHCLRSSLLLHPLHVAPFCPLISLAGFSRGLWCNHSKSAVRSTHPVPRRARRPTWFVANSCFPRSWLSRCLLSALRSSRVSICGCSCRAVRATKVCHSASMRFAFASRGCVWFGSAESLVVNCAGQGSVSLSRVYFPPGTDLAAAAGQSPIPHTQNALWPVGHPQSGSPQQQG
jgi:hypothetical protein